MILMMMMTAKLIYYYSTGWARINYTKFNVPQLCNGKSPVHTVSTKMFRN